MNIFVIPSWYPSIDYPLTGIMIYEQNMALCSLYPDVHVGISIWGQQEEQYLLWAKDHVQNICKALRAKYEPFSQKLLPNLKEYHKPTLSWTNKVAGGNFSAILNANLFNLKIFESDFGKVDLIHAQVNHPAGRIAMSISEKTGIPFCITERMSPFPCRFSSDKFGRLKEAWYAPYTKSAINITISPAQAKLMSLHDIPNIKVIPNYIDEDFFRPAPAKTVENKKFTFLTLTSGVPRKGIDVLLHAIKLIQNNSVSKNLSFRIGGIGDMTTYKDLARKLKLENSIVWLNQANRQEALKEFQNCDAFVLASYEESFGNVYAEAIACGKPVIATKCGGPESIVNEVNGLLVDKNNPQGLADAVLELCKNYSKYDIKAIRQDFINRFSKKTVLPQLVDLYKDIINKPILDKDEHSYSWRR